MARRVDFSLFGNGKIEIAAYQWSTSSMPKGIVFILHGMAEHALRYEEFAQFLTYEGYEVFAFDYRGHGKTVQNFGNLGILAEKNGWAEVVGDIKILLEKIREDYPGLPIFLFGHSMGSYLARTCMALFENYFAGIILSGTSVEGSFLINISHKLTKVLALFQGRDKRTPLLNMLTFGSFNRSFKPSRTEFDWLSRNETEVDMYCQDPLCGFVCTISFFQDLFEGILPINKPEEIAKIVDKPPILLLSGARDPVGHNGKDIRLLSAIYSNLGFDVCMKLYEGARHELIHEMNKEEVSQDVLSWLSKYCH